MITQTEVEASGAVAETTGAMTAIVSAAHVAPTYAAAISATLGALIGQVVASGGLVEFDYSITAREESQARRLNTESVGARVVSMATARRMGTESVAPSLGTIAIGRRIRGEGL